MVVKVVDVVLWVEMAVLTLVIIWAVVAEWRASRADKDPAPAPAVDLTAVMTRMIETNAEVQTKMLERGLEAVTEAVQRAAYGMIPEPDEPEKTDSPPGHAPMEGSEAPWHDWPSEVEEHTDVDIPELLDMTAPRAEGVAVLPDFTGERLDLGG